MCGMIRLRPVINDAGVPSVNGTPACGMGLLEDYLTAILATVSPAFTM